MNSGFKIWCQQAGDSGELMVYVSVWDWRQEKTDVPARRELGRKKEFFPTRPFLLFKSSTDWMRPPHIREGNLLYSVSWCKWLLLPRNTLTDTSGHVMLNQTSGHPSGPIKFTHKISHHIFHSFGSLLKYYFIRERFLYTTPYKIILDSHILSISLIMLPLHVFLICITTYKLSIYSFLSPSPTKMST